MKSILLVEDDASLGLTLAEKLNREGFQTHLAPTAQQALQYMDANKIDLAIFDVGLPDGSGFELAKELRQKTKAPFLFVTAQSSAEDRLLGYELGAEEFIPKPFHLKELLMRVNHVFENHAQIMAYDHKHFRIDFSSMKLERGDESIQLKLKQCLVLKLIIEKSPAVVSRDEMLNVAWGDNEFPSNRTVDNVIVELRQILGEQAASCIKSIRGVGYQWVTNE